MKVEKVMTTEVRTVTPDTPLKDVAKTLAEAGISGLPVVEDGVVVGVVSEADILIKERGVNPSHQGILGLLFDHGVATESKLNALTAGEAMTAPAITIGPRKPVSEAAAKMIDERVNRLPVVGEDGALLGIVTRADLVKAFVRSDAEIEREIRDELILRTLWIPPEQVTISVKDGTVTVFGRVDTKHDADLIVALTRRVPGVVSVDSHVTWVFDGDRPRKREEVVTR